MQQKQFRILFGVVLASTFTSCGKKGPEVDVCISRPASNAFVCVDKQQKIYIKPYAESDKYIAFSPDDAKKLLSSCNIGSAEQSAVMGYMALVEKITRPQHIANGSKTSVDGTAL